MARDLYLLERDDDETLDRLRSDDYIARELTSSAQGIRVLKYISDSSELAAPVRLQIKQMNSGRLLFDKDYGYQARTFDSGVIYLPYSSDGVTPCLVSLTVGNYVYAMPFMHKPRVQSQPQAGGWSSDGWDDGWSSDAPGWE